MQPRHLVKYPIHIIQNADQTFSAQAIDFSEIYLSGRDLDSVFTQVRELVENATAALSSDNIAIPEPSQSPYHIDGGFILSVEVLRQYNDHPEVIYYYRDVDSKLLEMLDKPYIWFSDPANFNDPYELPQVLSRVVDSFTIYREAEWFYNNSEKYGYDIHIKYSSPQDFYMNGIIDDAKKFSYSMTTRFNALYETTSKFTMACFSRVHDSVLMWSHYANKHAGVVIGYERDELFDSAKDHCSDVDYRWHQEKLKTLEIAGKEINDMKKYYLRRMFSKHPMWAYEQEYRIVNLDGIRDKRTIAPSAIKEIYLGAKISDTDKAKIRALSEGLGIKPKQMIAGSDFILRED